MGECVRDVDGRMDDWMGGETDTWLGITHKTEGAWLWVFTS
jgi:hypothetical protein